MFEKIQKIFYRPEFFRRQEFTGGQALGFYSLSILFLVLGFTLILIPGIWGVNRYFESANWQEQKAIIKSLYPDDLVLTFEDGKLSTNQAGPVVIPFPTEWEPQRGDCMTVACQEERDAFPANLLVIDGEAEVSRKAIERNDTFILASETEIGFSDSRKGKTEIIALTKIETDKKIEITNSNFDYWVIERGSVLIQRATLFIMSVLPLLMYLGLWIGYIVYALFGALIVWLAAHIRNHPLRYGQAYASTLYLLPASFVVSLLMSLLGFHIPLLFTFVLFGMAMLNFERRPKETVPTDSYKKESSIPVTPARPLEK